MVMHTWPANDDPLLAQSGLPATIFYLSAFGAKRTKVGAVAPTV
jgi:hypothetical protein